MELRYGVRNLNLEVVVLNCLEKQVDRRYGSAEHLADELQRFLDGYAVLPRETKVVDAAPSTAGENQTQESPTNRFPTLSGSDPSQKRGSLWAFLKELVTLRSSEP